MDSTILLYTVLSVIFISLISLVGALTLSCSKFFLQGAVRFLVSFAAGALLGDAFIHLLPEVVNRDTGGMDIYVSLAILAGIIIFLILEKFVRWRHCHISDAEGESGHHHAHPFAVMSLVGDSLHNFIDGAVIGASYLISIQVGIATTIAVALHEIPQEMGDFGVLIHGGFTRVSALILNFATALTALIGAFMILLIGVRMEASINLIVAFTAGGFIYIASSDLIPEMHKETRAARSVFELMAFILGIGVMALMLVLE